MHGDDRGFTLIELLAVTAIIGVLVSIAIPQYSQYRARSFDARVETAVRNTATAEEEFYVRGFSYTPDLSQLNPITDAGVVLSISPGNSGDLTSSFRVDGSHPSAAHTFSWTSDPLPGDPHLVMN